MVNMEAYGVDIRRQEICYLGYFVTILYVI